VKIANKDDADKVRSELLTAANINYKLSLFGLPAAKIIEVQHYISEGKVLGGGPRRRAP